MIHAAREDAHFTARFHTDDGVAAWSQKDGLPRLNCARAARAC